MVLIICNKEGTALYQKIGQSIGKDYQLVTSEIELTSFIEATDKVTTISSCFLAAELTWEGKSSTAHYGFEIAMKLRLGGLRCIFYFLAFTPPKLLEINLSKYALLRPEYYHRIIDLNQLNEITDNLSDELMSEDLLEDIAETLLAPKMLMREILHDLKNKVILKHNTPPEEIEEKLKNAVDLIFNELSLIVLDKKKELETIKEALLKKLLTEVKLHGTGISIKVVEDFTNHLVSLAPESNIYEEILEGLPQTRWKTLLVDDEKIVQESFEQGFLANNITYQFSDNVEDALQILKADAQKNLITVLVTDIRFKDNQTNKWDKLQGYDLLRKVHLELTNYTAKFAITAARKRLYRLKKNYQFPVNAYYKDDIQSSAGAMNVFCQKIREEGDEIYYKSRNRPQLSSWTKGNPKRFSAPLSLYYREHLFSVEYQSAEAAINEKSKEYVNKVLTGNVASLETIEFTGTIKNSSPTSIEGIHKFRYRTLIGRRVALALHLHDIMEDDIFRFMQPTAEVKDILASKKLLFNTSLALSFKKDLPNQKDIKKGMYLKSNLLEEEILWLIGEYGFDFDISKIRLDKQELDTIILILGDFQYSLATKNTMNPPIKQLQESFLKENLEKISSIKKVKSLFSTLQKILTHYEMKAELAESLKLDIEFIQNEEVKTFLVNLSGKNI